MGCEVSREQLWSWIDRDAPELESHLSQCEHCRSTAADIRRKIDAVAVGAGPHRPVPETVGPYVIRHFLGEGGQALVYEAEQPNLRRTVALKVLKGGRFASDKAVRRFHREARALGHLQHPGIAAVYEAGHTDEGLHYFAMERVRGTPLDTYVANHELTERDKLTLFQSICGAVQFAHRCGVIHRDLKPSNIFVLKDGTPKILDFGLAKLLRSGPAFTATATLVASGEGTPRYMSPEQATGRPEDIDERTDVYSLGVILYEMLTGQTPHADKEITSSSLHRLHLEPVPSPRVIDPGFPSDLEVVLLKALEKSPAERYATVEALAADVDRYLQARPIEARPPSWVTRVRRHAGRRRVWPWVAVLALVVAGIVAVRLTSRTPDDVEAIRFSLLKIRRDLLRWGDDPVVQSRAMDMVQRHSKMPEVQLLRAHAYIAQRRMSLAATSLRTYLENDRSLWYLEAMLHEIESTRGRHQEPLEPTPFPDTARNWYLRSFASIDVPRALAFAERGLRCDPADPMILATMAYLCEVLGHDEENLQWTSRLIAVGGGAPRWRIYKSQRLFLLGRYEDALSEADRLVASRPDDPNGYNTRARIARRLGLYDLAASDLSRSIELYGSQHPSAAWTYFHRGSAHLLNDQPERAAADYRHAYELLTYSTYANARLFLVLWDLGRHEEAVASLEDARHHVWEDPWLAEILSCLAGETSPEDLIAAARGEKQQCEALYYAAEVHRLEDDLPAAIDTYRACVALGLESDPDQHADEPTDTMTETELARWRLTQLAADTNKR